jgi:opacity protein-like surface antigen
MRNFFLLSVAIIPMTWGSAVAQMDAAPACCPCPKSFEGFNLGANIGYGIGGVTTKAKRDVGVTIGDTTFSQVAQASSRDNVRGVDGGLSVGYLHRFGSFAAGPDFTANWVGSSVSGNARSTITAQGPNGLITANANASYKVRLENSLQLAAKMGWVIDQALPFIKLGWDNSQWKVRGTANFGQSFTALGSKSKRLNAFLWGAGVDFLVVRHFTFGLEYVGTAAGSQKMIQQGGNSISIKPQYNKFALTAKYIFN